MPHLGLSAVISVFHAAFPRNCWIAEHSEEHAEIAVAIDAVPAIRVRLDASVRSVAAEVSLSGTALETVPIFTTHPYQGEPLQPEMGDAGWDVAAIGETGRWQVTLGEPASDGPLMLQRLLDGRWRRFQECFERQWQSAPEEWLARAEAAVLLPGCRAWLLSHGIQQASWLSSPRSAISALFPREFPGQFVVALLGFGEYGDQILRGDTVDRLSRLATAASAARRQLGCDVGSATWLATDEWIRRTVPQAG